MCSSDAPTFNPIPGVLVVHTAVGLQEDFISWKLDSIASQGYLVHSFHILMASKLEIKGIEPSLCDEL